MQVFSWGSCLSFGFRQWFVLGEAATSGPLVRDGGDEHEIRCSIPLWTTPVFGLCVCGGSMCFGSQCIRTCGSWWWILQYLWRWRDVVSVQDLFHWNDGESWIYFAAYYFCSVVSSALFDSILPIKSFTGILPVGWDRTGSGRLELHYSTADYE